MKWQNLPRMDEADIEDLRPLDQRKSLAPEQEPTPEQEGKGDYGAMSMRGYGKVEKNIRQWKVT